MPARWTGLLFLWSHGYQGSGPQHVSEPGDADQTPSWLLAHGMALATSSYSHGGWTVVDAMQDQIALLALFTRRYGRPRATIAWGASFGALVSAGLVERYPALFAGALPESGIFDPVGTWNAALDAGFAFKVLLAPHGPLQLAHITNPGANLATAQQVLARALRTAQGRARLVLAAALLDLPGSVDLGPPAPGRSDLALRVATLIGWLRSTALPLALGSRAELEHSAGGNPSWNTGADYYALLAGSIDRDVVQRAYAQAGLSLGADLHALARAPRITADPPAVAYLARNITLGGRLQVPVLTLHTTGDGVAPVAQEQVYAERVRAAGCADLLRQLFVRRAGHGTFTAPEEVTAIQVLLARVRTGRWGPLAPTALNQQARALGPALNADALTTAGDAQPAAPQFTAYRPPAYARPMGVRAPAHL
jgi:alpha-beta hydrolase superfamily lysophospholipase